MRVARAGAGKARATRVDRVARAARAVRTVRTKRARGPGQGQTRDKGTTKDKSKLSAPC
jgi:hypothetical protein